MEGRVWTEFVEPRDGALVAQQALRRHQDQRLPDLALELAAQDMEVVRRRRAVGALHIVLAPHLQEALEPRGGMLRAAARNTPAPPPRSRAPPGRRPRTCAAICARRRR